MRVEELPFRAVSQDDSSEETVFVRMMPLSVDLALVIRGCEQRQARSEWADAEVGTPLQLNVRKSPREVLNGAGRRVTGRENELTFGGHEESGGVEKEALPRGGAILRDTGRDGA